MSLHEKWSDYTDEEIRKIGKDKHCDTCYFSNRLSSNGNHKNTCCMFIAKTGFMRGCFPDDCNYHIDKNLSEDVIKQQVDKIVMEKERAKK